MAFVTLVPRAVSKRSALSVTVSRTRLLPGMGVHLIALVVFFVLLLQLQGGLLQKANR